MSVVEELTVDFVESSITLLVVLTLFSTTPFFQGLTADATDRQKKTIAKKSAAVTFAVPTVFAYLGGRRHSHGSSHHAELRYDCGRHLHGSFRGSGCHDE